MNRSAATLCGLLAAYLCCSLPQAGSAQIDGKSSTGASRDTVVVTLRAAAVVDQPLATVGAVAAIEGGEPWLRKRIADLDIAEAKRGGQPVIVTRDQITLRIQLAGIDRGMFKVEGPAQTIIDISTLALTEQAVVKAAQEAIVQRFKADTNDIEIRLLEDVHLPALDIGANDRVHLNVDTPPGAIGVGKTRVEIGVLLNGQRRATIALSLEVLVFRRVAIATRRIDAGETLAADAVRVERRAVGSNDQWLPYTEQLLGKRTMHAIAPGQTLSATDLDIPPVEGEVLIQSGETVKLVAAVGSLRLIASGEAMQEGRVGQVIRVRNIASGRIVVGRVMSRGTVEVDH